ncbi:MAG TPA: methyltransferase domain-containing protein [Candidatus Bathyarchaeia archaeon]|nr:methyltransferase domain-containing protein [Candidatus Bathyarchaeia archaeon]
MRGITQDFSIKEVGQVLDRFCCEFWFAPADSFLRAAEALLWSRQKLTRPILDIGCGDGRYSRLLLQHQPEIDIGLDINAQEVEIAKTSGLYRQVVVADAVKMPLDDNFFATVISNCTFEHIKDDLKAVKEVSRVLKAGGIFLFTVPAERLSKNLQEIIGNDLKFTLFNQRVSHFHYRSLSEWQKILKQNHLKVISHQSYLSQKALIFWYRLFRLATLKLRGRELWSYLKDSRYGRLLPSELIGLWETKYLTRYYQEMFSKDGNWLFIIAKKN